MNLVPVSSSNIRAIGYEPNTQTLQVEFHNGSSYEYYAVPITVHAGLMAANSHGSYFDAHIKKASYRPQKLR
jgi:hypothetical protein